MDFIVKRDGGEVPFNGEKITMAIYKAMLAVKKGTMEDAEIVSKAVVQSLEDLDHTPTVEEAQDAVESELMSYRANGVNFADVAKAYILYRDKRRILREEKARLGVKDDLKLTLNAVKVLESRYLLKDEFGNVKETPKELLRRVAYNVGLMESLYEYKLMSGKSAGDPLHVNDLQINVLKKAFKNLREEKTLDGDFDKFLDFVKSGAGRSLSYIKDFEKTMMNLEFVPNSPTLMNAGTPLGQLSACFVLPVQDSIDSIFTTLADTARIHKSGGGTGFSFSKLRPRDDLVGSTQGVASGAISFMTIFDTTTNVIKQGGKRRGANMGILRYDHPEIADFVTSKDSANTVLSNFNISVGIDGDFFDRLDSDEYVDLKNPRNDKVEKRVKASHLWNMIVEQAWRTGDPGLVFLDEINERNTVPNLGTINATNPCVTGDTRIFTDKGIRTARDLYEESLPVNVVTDGRMSPQKVQHASNVIMTGIKPVLKLQTSEGYSIRLTSDHPVFSNERGWVKAGDLEIGEKIRVLNREGGFGSQGSIEEGRVIGWLVGDGNINKGPGNKRVVLSFYDKDRSLAPDFVGYVNDIVREATNHRVYNVTGVEIENRNLTSIASERLKEYAGQIGLVENKLMVPEVIMTGNEQMQRGFLQALFEADGTVLSTSKLRYSVRLTSINSELLEQVQLLLLNFGIYSRIYWNRRKAGMRLLPDSNKNMKEYNCQAYHELCISRENIFTYAKKVGFLSTRKTEQLKQVVDGYVKNPRREKWLATVESKMEEGLEEVFDLIEPKYHAFIGNGLVIHNCGEQPLLANESCNLGSLNLVKFVKDGEIDFDRLRDVIWLSTRFLDDVIDANLFPVADIEKMTRTTRKIGLGIMGFADMLVELGIPYASTEALKTAEKVMSFVQDESHNASEAVAKERGAFPGWKGSEWDKKGRKMRNSTTTTIAPTGTISIIAGCSSSIEPLFALAFVRHVLDGQELLEANPQLERMLKERNLYSESLMIEIAKTGTLEHVDLPNDLKTLFETSQHIDFKWHVLMQAAFQNYCDSGVSKTVNLPNSATREDISLAYRLARDLHCKGITIYRDGSKDQQVLYTGSESRKEERRSEPTPDLSMPSADKLLKFDSTYDPACTSGSCTL